VSPALYLIDTSGVFRILQDKLRQAWSDHLAAGVIATCPVVELEFLYSARSLADRLEKRRLLHELFGWVPMSERAWERAEEVQQLLAEGAMHRSAGPVDLLIAATSLGGPAVPLLGVQYSGAHVTAAEHRVHVGQASPAECQGNRDRAHIPRWRSG